MSHLLHKSLSALALLSEEQYTLDQLADKMSTRKRHVQKVIKGLKESGFTIHSRVKNRVKYFWMTSTADWLPAVLSTTEQAALNEAIATKNVNLQSAVYKIVQLANVRLYINLQK